MLRPGTPGADLDRLLAALRNSPGGGLGVRAWSIYASESCRLALGVKDREIGNAHAPLSLAESCGARYLIVWDDGTISGGYLERRQLEDDPARTLRAARAAAYDDPDAAHVLGPAEMPAVDTYHAEAAAMAAGDTTHLARRLSEVRRRVADAGARTWSGSFSANHRFARIVSSAGLDAAVEGTTYGWFVTVDGEIGTGRSARGPESDTEFDERLERLMDLARRLTEPGAAIADGTLPVVLHPRVVEEYVLGTLLHHLDGATVSHGEGLFPREEFGSDRPVFREDFGLTLDPLQPLRAGSYSFTVEGVPARCCALIDRGRLVQPILDIKYSRRLGLPATPLPQAMDTVIVTGPERLSMTQALAEARGGALVLSVLGVHTQDSASGDFSLSAPQVLRIGEHGLAGRSRATISGNLFDLLRSDALRWVEFEGEHTPGLLFPCRIAGSG